MLGTWRSLVPIADALPELRAEQYAKVREWDAARMSLEGEYEAADGEYLSKIRDALQRANGARTPLWKAYLDARDIPYQTAVSRIHKAEGHVVTPRDNMKSISSPAPTPPQRTTITPRNDLDWPPPEPESDDTALLHSLFRIGKST